MKDKRQPVQSGKRLQIMKIKNKKAHLSKQLWPCDGMKESVEWTDIVLREHSTQL